MLNALRRTTRNVRHVQALYAALTAAARQPVFFRAYGVADTVDGRFDMVALHAWLALRWLKAAGRADLAQGLSDAIFVAFDEALRDLGNGDMGMGPRMKKLGNAFAGRLHVYEAAGDEAALADAILRNVYRGAADRQAAAAALARYAQAAAGRLKACDPLGAALDFGPIPTTFSGP
ncbi:MAG TPA: ubiquinol-cytochrome C chaperone family protein [Rhizomicrobium sp.]